MSIPIRHGRQLDYLREAGRLAAEILALTALEVRPGVTTRQVEEVAIRLMKERSCKSAFYLYKQGRKKFPGHICISINDEVVHGIGGSRVIHFQDLVKIDVGIITDAGWVGDNALTVAAGGMTAEAQKLMWATEEALETAISHAVPGGKLSDLCGSVEECVGNYGFTVVRDLVGHGVGRKLHEEPQVPNYWDRATMKQNPRLRAGMVLAIEPMVNAGVAEVMVLKDEWTIVTKDSALSSHFEHMVLITDNGPEVLTSRPRTAAKPAGIEVRELMGLGTGKSPAGVAGG